MRLLPSLRREAPPPDTTDTPSLGPKIGEWWSQVYGSPVFGAAWSPRLQERVWVVNRCMQLCAQQIASMPLRFFGTYEPAWVANPDPAWFPNGIGDAVFAAAWSMYGWGDAFLLVTARYSNGFPSAWTVLDPASMNVDVEAGRRRFRSGNVTLDPDDVIQITRDPTGRVRGTSALQSYAQQAWGLVAGSALGSTLVSGGGIPNAVLKSQRKLTADQAQAIQDQWVAARARASIGAPAVLPPEIDFEQLAFSAQDLLLLDLQEYDVRAIASAFSVPSFMLNMPLEGGLTYQNPETLFEVWWRCELRPAAGRVQRALSANMLPRGSWVEFDARAALAPTFQHQVEAWLKLQAQGVVTSDEVRAAILHLPPLAQGEAIADLTEPPTAAASPTSTPDDGTVTELRPTGVMA